MKDCVFSPRRSLRLLVYAVAAVLLIAPAALAQQSLAGNVYGSVRDNQNNALPGVTVTLSGIGAPRVFITDEKGEFRFLNLDPGRYTARAELSGFGPITRSNVDVNIQRNTRVDVAMQPAIAQMITVTAETPLLDVRKTGTGATVTQFELEQLPSARDPWVVLQQVPGVTLDRINVGGNESGQQSTTVSKGAARFQNTWNVDGVAITDMAATGASPIYFDFDAYAEIQATTAGSDPRIQTPGIQMNLVTKRGTNEWQGSGRYFFTGNEYQADASIPAEAQGYLRFANQIDEIFDYGAEVGGPILRDRLWLWGSYGKNEIDLLAAIGGTRQARDLTILENWNGKLNAQIMTNNSFVGTYQTGDKIKEGRDVGPTRPPETAWNQSGLAPIWKIEDTHIFSPNFMLTGMLSHVGGGFQLIPVGGFEVSYFAENGVFGRSFFGQIIDRPVDQYRVDGINFVKLGGFDNELKYGFGYREAPIRTEVRYPGTQNFHNFATGLCATYRTRFPTLNVTDQCGRVDLQQNVDRQITAEYTEFYVGDTMSMGNLTVQLGVRYDLQSAQNLPSTIGANPLSPERLPEVTFQGDAKALDWTSWSPRLGATYSFGTVHRTLVRAAYNRYVDQMAVGVPSPANPTGNTRFLQYVFNDLNGDKEAQLSEILFDARVGFGNLDPNNPGSLTVPVTRIDYNMEPPKTNEVVLGVEHELRPEFTIGANVTLRKLSDYVWTRSEKTPGGAPYTSADYELAGQVTGTTPSGESYSRPYYRLRPGVATPVYSVVTNRPDYEQNYQGLELFATKRLTNRWMMRGNLTFNDWTQDVGPGAIVDPTPVYSGTYGCFTCDGEIVFNQSSGSGGKTYIFMNSEWSYNLSGVYQLPWDITLGASATGWQGYPDAYTHNIPVTQGTPAVTVTKQVLVEPLSDSRNQDIFSLDLRIAKEFRLMNRVGITVSADLFNATNERPVLQRVQTLYNNATTVNPRANRIEEIQSPQVFRFGARVTF